jgi:transposase
VIRELIDENEALRAQLAEQAAALQKLQSERDQLLKKYARLAHEVELLRRQLYGKKGEKVSAAQLELALLPVLEAMGRLQAGDATAVDDAEKALAKLRNDVNAPEKPKRQPKRRKPAELQLPVVEVVLEPAERTAPGGEELEKIGEEVSEFLERRPASMTRVRLVRPKYKQPAAADGSTPVLVAPMPDRPLPKSLAGPGLLAHVLVSKYADHIPLHRQERIFKREGVPIPRSTLAGWIEGSVLLLRRVTDAMWEDARRDAPVAIADATGVLVQAKVECRRNHFYVVVVPGRHVLFRFLKNNTGAAVAEILQGFKNLQVDASSVYHELYRRNPEVMELGCWAHARRKFFEALSTDEERALLGIGFIGLLYDAHRASQDPEGKVDTAKRARACRPILARFFSWVRAERRRVEPGTPIAKAFGYVVRQRRPLTRFLKDGRIRLDTNPAELELRRQVVGRKNWLFIGSDDAALWNTTTVSLVASCQMHGLEPWAYLRDVLTLLPVWDQTRVIELAPHRWQETEAREKTQRLLHDLDMLRRAGAHGPDAASSQRSTS